MKMNKKFRQPKSKHVGYLIAMVMIYLMGYSFVNNNTNVSSFVAGIVIGIAIGAYYIQQRIIELKRELESQVIYKQSTNDDNAYSGVA